MNKLYVMDASKCLDQIHKETIKFIYIDPPYNTKAKHFEYNDDNDNWDFEMKKILSKAQDKLKEDGCIFISIDDNKLFELKLICDSIFSKKNYLGLFITRQATRSNSKHINTIHEYVLAYAKDKNKLKRFTVYRKDLDLYKPTINTLIKDVKTIFKNKGQKEANIYLNQCLKKLTLDENYSWIRNYNLVDENGEIFFAKDLSTPSKPFELIIAEINLKLPKLKTRGWSSKEKIIKLYNQNKLIFKGDRPYEKHFLYESEDNVMSIINFYSRQGTHDLDKLGLKDLFKTPKPVEMIKYLIQIATGDNDLVLDFFAGSGSTAQAVLELNHKEQTNRKFVLCQNKEKIKNNPKAIQKLKEYNLENEISNITYLRLEKLKELYNFEYEIIVE